MDSAGVSVNAEAQLLWLEEANKLLGEAPPSYLPGSWMHAHALYKRLKEVEAQNGILRSHLHFARCLLSKNVAGMIFFFRGICRTRQTKADA